jgi:hypothetical protein
MITIAVSAAVMGAARVATYLLEISRMWIDGDAMALCVESERVSTANGQGWKFTHISFSDSHSTSTQAFVPVCDWSERAAECRALVSRQATETRYASSK